MTRETRLPNQNVSIICNRQAIISLLDFFECVERFHQNFEYATLQLLIRNLLQCIINIHIGTVDE